MGNFPFLYALALSILLSLSVATKALAADISSYAFVQDDGSLRVDGRAIRLFGIYIPQQPSPAACSSGP